MKCYTQVYVKNSYEAAKMYCKAFGAEITREFKNADDTAYEHCELSVKGEGILALAEAANPCDIEVVHKMKWETMTFNAFDLGSVTSVELLLQWNSEKSDRQIRVWRNGYGEKSRKK